jgi:hypothetical protein
MTAERINAGKPRSVASPELSIPEGWNFHITTLVAYNVEKVHTLSLLGVNYIIRR